MGKYVAENLVKHLIKAEKPVKNAKVAILGFTFKENCPDTRNTKIIDIVKELREYGIEPIISDTTADRKETKNYTILSLLILKRLKRWMQLSLLLLIMNSANYP